MHAIRTSVNLILSGKYVTIGSIVYLVLNPLKQLVEFSLLCLKVFVTE